MGEEDGGVAGLGGDAKSDFAHESLHFEVLVQDVGVDGIEALVAGDLDKTAKKLDAEAAAVILVADEDGDFGRVAEM